jgi:hypothetical protein
MEEDMFFDRQKKNGTKHCCSSILEKHQLSSLSGSHDNKGGCTRPSQAVHSQ